MIRNGYFDLDDKTYYVYNLGAADFIVDSETNGIVFEVLFYKNDRPATYMQNTLIELLREGAKVMNEKYNIQQRVPYSKPISDVQPCLNNND